MLLGKVLKDQDTLIEQSPCYKILYQNSLTCLNVSDSAINICKYSAKYWRNWVRSKGIAGKKKGGKKAKWA